MVSLRAGDARCEVDAEDGGRLASLVVGGEERLLTRAAADDGQVPSAVVAWGSFLMAPWIGRLDRGVLPWRGRTHHLPPDFQGHAIHGTVKDQQWEVTKHNRCYVELVCPLTEPWPFGGTVIQSVLLWPHRLDLFAEVAAGDEPMPAALGWHPWFARPSQGDLRLQVAGTGTLALRDDLIPTGEVAALTATTDLRDGPPLGDRLLDDTYTDVGPPVFLTWPDLTLRIGWSTWRNPVNSVSVHTPPRGVCVEPQTSWPNAPALLDAGSTRTGLVTVEPGRPLRALITWSWEESDWC